MADLRTPAEIAYDLARLSPIVATCTVCAEPTSAGAAYCDACGEEVLSDAEARAIDVLYPSIPIVRSRDAAHREERWLNILETIADMDELEQSEMLGYVTGLLDGLAAKQALAKG